MCMIRMICYNGIFGPCVVLSKSTSKLNCIFYQVVQTNLQQCAFIYIWHWGEKWHFFWNASVNTFCVFMSWDCDMKMQVLFPHETSQSNLFEGGILLTLGLNSTLCFVICCVILAVCVPMGSAELSRLSVVLSHSPSGSRDSWNWRAKTCSSSNCLCLGAKRKG